MGGVFTPPYGDIKEELTAEAQRAQREVVRRVGNWDNVWYPL